jgi:hypothetical protein
MAAPSFRDYWSLRVSSATQRLKAARTIVRHRATRGVIAERVLADLLTEFLPVQFCVSTGFILSPSNVASRQVDVLVYDRLKAAPIYRDNVCSVVSPGMAVLALESKTFLKLPEFKDACENIRSVKALNEAVTGVVFAFGGMLPATIERHLRAVMRSVPPKHRVDFFMNLGSDYVVRLDPGNRGTYTCWKSAGVVVNTLLLQAVLSANAENLSAYLEGVPQDTPLWNLRL